MHHGTRTGAAPGALRLRRVGLGLAAAVFMISGAIPADAHDPARDAPDDAVAKAIASLDSWAFGDLEPRYVATPSRVDAGAARARVAAWRTIADPLARAQAELDAWMIPVTVVAPDDTHPIDAAQARARVLELRAIADPIERAQASLSGWQVP